MANVFLCKGVELSSPFYSCNIYWYEPSCWRVPTASEEFLPMVKQAIQPYIRHS